MESSEMVSTPPPPPPSEEEQTALQESTPNQEEEVSAQPAAAPPASTTKKVSAKEYVIHVKNLKKKILDLEQQVSTFRARGVASVAGIALEHLQARRRAQLFHEWHSMALQTAANNQVERIAQMANRANQDLEQAKDSLATTAREKLEAEALTKKLKILLQKAKQQVTEMAKQHEVCPTAQFTLGSVVRKVITPTGESFCLVQVAPNKFEFRSERIVQQWLPYDEQIKLTNMPSMEEEFADRYQHMQNEMELALATAQAALEAEQSEFQQFRMRAELAFERQQSEGAQSSRQTELERDIDICREELLRVAAERDNAVLAAEQAKRNMEAMETMQAQMRIREQNFKFELEALEQRVAAGQEQQHAAAQQFAVKLDTALQAKVEELDLEREQKRKLQLELDLQHKLVKETELKHQNELKTLEAKHRDALGVQQDRIRILESNLNRKTAQEMIASPPPAIESEFEPTPTPTSVSSRLQPAPLPFTTPSMPSRSFSERRDSDASFDSSIFTDHTAATQQHGSKYFVDQMGLIRNQVRMERVEWQRERAQLKQQIEDSVRRKEDAEQRIALLERKAQERELDAQRQQLLGGGAPAAAVAAVPTADGLVYLKNCVFRFITADDDSERETLLPVITMLLKFNPDEVKALQVESSRDSAGKGLLGGLLSRWG